MYLVATMPAAAPASRITFVVGITFVFVVVALLSTSSRCHCHCCRPLPSSSSGSGLRHFRQLEAVFMNGKPTKSCPDGPINSKRYSQRIFEA
ncbi:hypothetical protein EDB86DRAFT_2950128 [Lactarius hatsudake]|nr:hypothetical protein EDB86DRAFT_2950128 [Lactarius hatsudake]